MSARNVGKVVESVSFASNIAAAKDELLKVGNYDGWMVLGYQGNTIVIQSQGKSGGVVEVVKQLKDDEVQYVLIRLSVHSGVVDGSAKQYTRDIFITWTGPAVKIIEKGKKKGNLPAVAAHLQPHHVELEAVNRESFTEANVRARSDPTSGSHVID